MQFFDSIWADVCQYSDVNLVPKMKVLQCNTIKQVSDGSYKPVPLEIMTVRSIMFYTSYLLLFKHTVFCIVLKFLHSQQLDVNVFVYLCLRIT